MRQEHGSTDGEAKIVLRVRRLRVKRLTGLPVVSVLRIQRPTFRIQRAVTKKIIGGSVKLIRARFHRKVYDAVTRFTEFGSKIALQGLKLLHRLRRYALVPLRIGRDQRNRNAIDQNICCAFLPTVEFEIIVRVAPRIIGHTPHKTWHQGDELNWVANRSGDLQRKVVHQGVLNGRTDIRALRLQLPRIAGDSYTLA